MKSLSEKFDELCAELAQGLGSIQNTGFDPVYYLVFPAAEILDVKRALPLWESRMRHDGLEPERLSMIDVINGHLRQHDLREDLIEAAEAEPEDFGQVNEAIADLLETDDVVAEALRAKLEELEGRPGAVLLITDVEALHPYLRIGGVEQALQGKFTVPTVILYPGDRGGGAFSLRFLGIHKEDGNYRSRHIG